VTWPERADEALAAFRGSFPRAAVSPRQIANTLTSPGCQRRRLLDMAEVDVAKLAQLLDARNSRISSFAITRSRLFQSRVTDAGASVAIALARQHLALDQKDVRHEAVDAATVRSEAPTLHPEQVEVVRLRQTRRLLEDMLAGSGDAVNVVRKPLTTLALGGRIVHIEHDLMLFASTTQRIHLVEIRDYPEIDGVLEPSRVGQTKREAAIALISLQQMVAELDGDPDIVSSRVLLITPKQLVLTPVARVVDAGPQMMRLRRLIEASPTSEAVDELLDDVPALPAMPGEDAEERQVAMRDILAAVSALPYRLGQGCGSCALQSACRRQATQEDQVQVLGSAAAQVCGSVTTVARALDLADERIAASTASETAVQVGLDRARRALDFAERLGVAHGSPAREARADGAAGASSSGVGESS